MRVDERALAASAALLLPLLGLLLLARVPVLRMKQAARGDDALQVVWIVREAVETADHTRTRAQAGARQAPRRVRRHEAGAIAIDPPPRRRALTSAGVASDSPPVADAPVPVPVPLRGGPLDLHIPESTLSFERDPHARAGPDIERPTALGVEIHDRSLGGRLQRMTRASICGELRRALHGGGGDVVVRTMQKHGCRI